MHEEKNSERKTKESVKEGAVPTYLMEREGVSRAKVICLTEKPHHSSKKHLANVPSKVLQSTHKSCKTYLTKVHKAPHQSSVLHQSSQNASPKLLTKVKKFLNIPKSFSPKFSKVRHQKCLTKVPKSTSPQFAKCLIKNTPLLPFTLGQCAGELLAKPKKKLPKNTPKNAWIGKVWEWNTFLSLNVSFGPRRCDSKKWMWRIQNFRRRFSSTSSEYRKTCSRQCTQDSESSRKEPSSK